MDVFGVIERSLEMQYMSNVLRCVLIITLFSGLFNRIASSDELSLAGQTLKAIEDCMANLPIAWPDEWKQEYLETIRKTVKLHRDASHYDVRLKILSKEFVPYWEGFTKSTERSLFEVHQAQIRWYAEQLMSTKFPTEVEKQQLRDQYTDLWNYSANSLLKQFPFLDPNAVEKAKADDLSECYRKVDAPLMPVYLHPFTEAQVEQIKQRYDKLRYARVDIWRQLEGGTAMPTGKSDEPPPNAERDYKLTQKSLFQLQSQIWAIVAEPPDYYQNAVENWKKAVQNRFQAKRQARSYQQRLEKERSRQLLQTEHISFLLTALLETPSCLDGSAPSQETRAKTIKAAERTEKGGEAYEVDNASPGK